MEKNARWKRIAWSIRRTKKRARRRIVLTEKRALRNFRREKVSAIAPKQFVKGIGRQVNVLPCPRKLNLSDNCEETLTFIHNVNTVAKGLLGRFHVDLTHAEEITPAGALLLVAAFDRWRETVPGQRLRAVSLERWNPDVRRKLKEMGFFEVLNANCNFDDPVTHDSDRYLPFLSGHGSEGDQAQALRRSIESLGPAISDRGLLYDGLVEAMTNVKQHAYDESESVKRWWMSASVNVSKNKLTIMFLDHGQGIPTTLPRSKFWEQARGLLARFGADAFKDDARLIEAALTIEKSRTGDDFRGNGLRQDVKGYVESHRARGRLRVLSRRGKCVYDKDANGSEAMAVAKLEVPLRGTFLEWMIEEYSEREDHRN